MDIGFCGIFFSDFDHKVLCRPLWGVGFRSLSFSIAQLASIPPAESGRSARTYSVCAPISSSFPLA